ncbi:MAG: glycoside hydrolase family 57 protein [Prolixibacteraceae bacterium]
MKSICLCFTVHQPVRLRKFRFFDIGNSAYYYNDYHNEFILQRIAENCYLPANKILLDQIQKFKGRFKVSFSISGTAIDQFKLYAPEVLDSFKELAATGCVEFLSETYSHSLVSIRDKKEFRKQVEMHASEIETLFGMKPTAFSNTELIYSDEIGATVAGMGYKTVLTEGSNHILKWRSPNYVYQNSINPNLSVLLKNDRLSDDISFRFSNTKWVGWPLTAQKYVSWMTKIPGEEKIVNLFMDYETFGERQKKDSGILDFLQSFPSVALRKSRLNFMTPSEVAANYEPVSVLNVPHPISWADEERDLSAWLGNDLQREAFDNLYELLGLIDHCTDADLLKDWRYLQTSDHFHYMSTKFFSDGAVHAYFSPYESPYEAFLNYMNVLNDFSVRLNNLVTKNIIKHIQPKNPGLRVEK